MGKPLRPRRNRPKGSEVAPGLDSLPGQALAPAGLGGLEETIPFTEDAAAVLLFVEAQLFGLGYAGRPPLAKVDVVKGHSHQGTEGEQYLRMERGYGTFTRSFSLTQSVDASGIKASSKDGILRIELPKKEEVKPKQIVIEG